MKLGDSIRKNSLWILTGQVFGRGVGFVIGVALARLLIPADFGMIVTIQIFTGVASYFAGGGIGEALVRAKDLREKDYEVVFTLQLLICVLIYAVFFLIAPWFAIWFGNPLYTDLVRVSTLNFLIRPFARVPRSKLKREMKFRPIAIVGVISTIVGGVVSIMLAFEGYGPWSLVYGGLSGSVSNVICFYAVTKWRPGISFDGKSARSLGSYGIKTTANSFIEYLRNQSANLIISRMLGPSSLGLFNKANSLSGLPMQMVGSNAYPTVFRALSKIQDNLDQSKYIFYRTITLVTVYTIPFYVGLFWAAESFVINVYGPRWGEAVIPLEILTFTGVFRAITSPSGAVIAAQNRLGTEICIQLSTWVILLVGCMVGIRWGINGVALGVLPSFFYRAVCLASLANRCIGGTGRELANALLPAFLLNGILAFGCTVTDLVITQLGTGSESPYYLLAMGGVGLVVYLVCFLFLPIKSIKSEADRWKKLLYRREFGMVKS